MRLLICLALISLCAAGSSRGAQEALQSWDFSKASDTLGWTIASGADNFGVHDGALSGTLTSDVFRLVSPLFEIKALPSQCVEFELSTDADGSGQMYFSNTTDEPYGGFRPSLLTSFSAVGDGKFHRYVILPFWQEQGKIIHIRLDPPGKHFALRSIRIVQRGDGTASNASSWDFKNTLSDWVVTGGKGASAEQTDAGATIRGTRETVFMSPMLDLDSGEYPWVTLRISCKSDQTAGFKWASSDFSNMTILPIRLIDDGRIHSYTINLGEVGDWRGRILSVGVTPTESSDPEGIVLESVRLGKAPIGPAELQVKRLVLADPYQRVGDAPSKVILDVVNAGGTTLKHVKAAVKFTGKTEPRVSKSQTVTNNKTGKQGSMTETSTGDWKIEFSGEIGELAPGQTGCPNEWKMAGVSAGAIPAVATVTADGVEPVVYKTTLQFYPKLDPKTIAGLKYVPEPKPADTGDYLVGCYYFPGWRDYSAWSVLDSFPERKPLLGYYHDGNPECADWHINWALSHGINFFIYDWYWSQGGRSLEEGLHDGLFKAKYQDKLKFCLLWANHNGAGTSSYDDMIKVTKYWIANYFNRPNYLKINGKNVMVIFSPQRFTDDMGVETTKKAFAEMRRMCEAAGVGGLYMVACVYPQPHWIKICNDVGYDALSGYNYPSAGDKGQLVAPYSWMVDGYKSFWEDITRQSGIPYIPLCDPGWDNRPWGGVQARVRTGKTVELFHKMLSNAKAYDDDPNHKLPEGKKLVFCEAWNEYGEGDYIEPHQEFGFGYLEAIRQVFAPKSKPPTIVLPKDIGLGPYDVPGPSASLSWDFSKPADRVWHASMNVNIHYDGGALHGDVTGNDPRINGPAVRIDASKHKTIEIRMKSSAADTAQLFFAPPSRSISEERSVKFAVKGDGEFHVYTVDLSANPLWKGTIGALSLDPNSTTSSTFEIAYIKFRE